jgi:hypothetical protein
MAAAVAVNEAEATPTPKETDAGMERFVLFRLSATEVTLVAPFVRTTVQLVDALAATVDGEQEIDDN